MTNDDKPAGGWFGRLLNSTESKPGSQPSLPLQSLATSGVATPGVATPGVDLALRLDSSGRVMEIHGPLRHNLAVELPTNSGRALVDFLLPSSRLVVEGEPRDWAGQGLDLNFQGLNELTLHTRGWLQALGNGWLLQLIDISDLLRQNREWQVRQECLLFTGVMAELILACSAERLDEIITEQLQKIAQRWHIPCVGVAVLDPDGMRWRINNRYVNHGGPELWQIGKLLEPSFIEFMTSGLTGPVSLSLEQTSNDPRWQNLFGHGPALLVPYCEGPDVTACLLCGFYDAQARAPDLAGREWSFLVGGLCGPLLSRLREKRHQYQFTRLEVLQGMLGAGWWEYLPASAEVHLAPLLALGIGADTQEMNLERWLDYIHPADRQELSTRLRDLPISSKPLVVNVRIKTARKEQAYTWFRMQAQLLGAEEGRRVVGFMLDISDIKTSEIDAAAAHARLDNLIASSPAVIYVQRYVEGALQAEFFSNSLGPLLGWSLADLQKDSVGEFIHPEDRDLYFQRTRQLLREGSASARYRFRNKQGNYHWLLDEAKLLRDDLGVPQEAVGLWLDITETTLAAEQVRKSEERYRILVEDSPAMICRYRPDLNVTFANRPLANYLELSVEALQGANLADWFSAEQRDSFLKRLASLTPDAPLSTAEVCLQLPGRENAWWVWADRGVFDEHGALVEVQAVGRDNTELRRSQQQLNQSAKMATLGEMATGLAHEINQPLNVMRMAVANVMKRLSNGDIQVDYMQEKLARIEAQVQRAAKIVDHMRVFGRRSEIEQHLFNPADAVDGSLSLLSEGMRGKGVELRVGNLKVEGRVSGHVDQLEQVLINLMVNARDALLSNREKNPELAPWINVSLEQANDEVLFWVEDNGGGIDPRLLERIFEPFFTTKPIGVGTGLGLSVSYGIVEQMGGKLSVTNASQGARFCIALPVAS